MDREPDSDQRSEPERQGDLATPTRRRLSPLVLTAAIVLAVATVFAGGAGWWWSSAASDEPLNYAKTRDDLLQAGQQAILNFNTLDHRTISAGFDVWEQSSTGDLHNELVRQREANIKQISAAKAVTTAKLIAAAVTELDARAGKGVVMATLEITVTPDGQPGTVKRNRFVGQLTRVDPGWKLSRLSPVPIETTGS